MKVMGRQLGVKSRKMTLLDLPFRIINIASVRRINSRRATKEDRISRKRVKITDLSMR